VRRVPWARLVPALIGLALSGCAPIAAYRGPAPAPGSVRTWLDSAIAAESSGTRRRLIEDLGPGSPRDAAPAGAPVTVILYGDNRGGYRMQYRATEYRAVSRMFSSGLGGFAKGLLFAPIFLVESIVPTLDGPRDLVTAFTRYTRAGGEHQVLEAMGPFLPAQVVISTGDVVTDGRRGRLWEDFVTHHRALREQNLYLAAPGNHERLYDPVAARGWRAAIGEPPESGCHWYRADLSEVGARFVFLDSDLLADVHGNYVDSLWDSRADAQLDFAEHELSARSRYKFVVLHHPPVTTGHYEKDWAPDSAADPVPVRRQRLIAMCARNHVTAVLAGHEHLYYRLFVADSSGAGFWEVISGGGGAPLYPIEKNALERSLADPMPAGLRVVKESAWGLSEFHFCRIVFPPIGDHAANAPLALESYRARSGGRVERIDRVDLAAPPSRQVEQP